ncbi:Nitrogen permease regulator 2 [Savitreella phatthalungensis]
MSMRHDLDEPSFPRMLAAFLCIFHPKAGPTVLFQIPDGFVGFPTKGTDSVPAQSPALMSPESLSASNAQPTWDPIPLASTNNSNGTSCAINFDAVSEYLIPKHGLCGRSIAVCHAGKRILGHPIAVTGEHYERNAFIFNCCVAFHETDDVSSYIPVVRRLAVTLRAMEELKGLLSNEHGRETVYQVIEQVLEDLNNYCECMIPIVDDEVTLNLKLFPKYPDPPPEVTHADVPVPTVRLRELCSTNWDLSLQRVIPFVDGVSSVARIAARADVDVRVACSSVRHLVYGGCVTLTDMFQFGGRYAPTPDLAKLAADPHGRDECRHYVAAAHHPPKDFAKILFLYGSLRPDATIAQWILKLRDHARRKRKRRPPADHHTDTGTSTPADLGEDDPLEGVDVRRLISYGIIKGVIYRIHQYPLLVYNNAGERVRSREPSPSGGRRVLADMDALLDLDLHANKAADQATVTAHLAALASTGQVSLDAMAAATALPPRIILDRLAALGTVHVIAK